MPLPALMSRLFPHILVLIALIPFLTAPEAAGQQTLDTILDQADPERIQRDVMELASGRYRGRATGTEEMIEASLYVREQLVGAGLHPAIGDSSYFQRFRVDYNQIKSPARLSTVVGGDTTHLEPLRDFMPDQHSGSGRFPWSDLLILDSTDAQSGYVHAAGKVALYLPPTLHDAPEDLDAFDRRGLPARHQLSVARALHSVGARAMLVPGLIYGRIGMESVEGFPIFIVTRDEAERLVAERGQRTVRIAGKVRAELHRDRETVNVVGRWPGSDQELADQHVLVTAHTDHVGTIAGGVHYGAHDNATGTAVLIEVARLVRAAADRGMTPRRSILFVGFSGEEMGLAGSRYYVEADPVVPLNETMAVLNLDIVGGGTGFMMVGALNFPTYYELVAELNEARFGHEIRKRDNAPNSDHYFFGARGIPAAFLYALDGPPIAIHTPNDTADKMDPAFMADAARLAFAVVWRLANLNPDEAGELRVQAAP